MTDSRTTIQYTARVSSPPIQVILAVLVALFILFLWLNFVLTQEIESVGREIQAKTEEMQAAERQQAVLLKEISVLGSQERMADQAAMMGYQPQTPVYLSVAEPLGQRAGEAVEHEGEAVASASSGEQPVQQNRTLWALLAGRSKTLSETEP